MLQFKTQFQISSQTFLRLLYNNANENFCTIHQTCITNVISFFKFTFESELGFVDSVHFSSWFEPPFSWTGIWFIVSQSSCQLESPSFLELGFAISPSVCLSLLFLDWGFVENVQHSLTLAWVPLSQIDALRNTANLLLTGRIHIVMWGTPRGRDWPRLWIRIHIDLHCQRGCWKEWHLQWPCEWRSRNWRRRLLELEQWI